MIHITIPLVPITKKNHSAIVSVHGRPMLIPSKQYREYEKKCLADIVWNGEPINSPVNVRYEFYVPTRRACDLVNHIESINDILVRAGVFTDDNVKIIESHDGSRVYWDKENPRTEVYITESKERRHAFDERIINEEET